MMKWIRQILRYLPSVSIHREPKRPVFDADPSLEWRRHLARKRVLIDGNEVDKPVRLASVVKISQGRRGLG